MKNKNTNGAFGSGSNTARMKLKSVHAFYKNDEPGGLGIGYTQPHSGFPKMIDKMLKSWDTDATPERMHEQLKQIGEYVRLGNTLSDKLTLIAFVDIIWLESRNHLTVDNYNGGQWIWQKRENVFLLSV